MANLKPRKHLRAGSRDLLVSLFILPARIPNMFMSVTRTRLYVFRTKMDLKARGGPETLIADIPSGNEHTGGGGHWTRDVAFSTDGKKMYVAVGSRGNIADTDSDKSEYHRANILESNPDGSDLRVYAWGIRNPVGIA